MGPANARRGTRLDDADDRYRRKALLQLLHSDRRGRITGDHQILDPAAHKELARLDGVAQNRIAALGAVRQPRGIAQIQEIFARKLGSQRAQNGEPADAGIEYPDGQNRTRSVSH